MRLTHVICLLFYYVPVGAFLSLCFAVESISIKEFPLENAFDGKGRFSVFFQNRRRTKRRQVPFLKRCVGPTRLFWKESAFHDDPSRPWGLGDFDGDGWDDLFFAHSYGGIACFVTRVDSSSWARYGQGRLGTSFRGSLGGWLQFC